ncbi:MFS transporter [Vampirovibrio sp.]|uniref:MFS transporter n=1 Tax=Vampirovibrio sp. TaxID=2717857 RepID=UPI0035944A75
METATALPAKGMVHQLKHTVRALQSRNFRLFISGQLVSLIGNWIQQMAMSWLVYRLTHSGLLLGLVAFLNQGPGLLIAPFAGLLADRYDRRKLLMLTQSLAMLQAFILAYLTLSGQIQEWHILTLSAFLGIIAGLDIPIRQSMVLDLLDKPEYLSNAISLNSSVFNGSRLIGPAIAGLAISTVGEGWCFLLNGLSFLAVIGALSAITIHRETPTDLPASYWERMKEGWMYVYRHPPMRSILLLIALNSLVGLPYSVLVPIYAKDILHGNAQTLGLLMGAVGAGALSGAVYLASRHDVLGLGRLIPAAVCGFGLTLLVFSQIRDFWAAMICLYCLGLGMMLHLASSNILLQTLVDAKKRGRVMSLYTMAYIGMYPFGSLCMGWLSGKIGFSTTLLCAGGLTLLGVLGYWWQYPKIRAYLKGFYLEKGMLKEPVKS